jgi:hypothetical protein
MLTRFPAAAGDVSGGGAKHANHARLSSAWRQAGRPPTRARRSSTGPRRAAPAGRTGRPWAARTRFRRRGDTACARRRAGTRPAPDRPNPSGRRAGRSAADRGRPRSSTCAGAERDIRRSAGRRSGRGTRCDDDTLQQTIARLQQKGEVPGQTHFGPEGEQELGEILREQFPGDRIERRGKGGDVLHTVLDAGRAAGKFVYEVKNTRGWQVDYVRQTKLPMESHGTRYGALGTHALPARSSGLSVVAAWSSPRRTSPVTLSPSCATASSPSSACACHRRATTRRPQRSSGTYGASTSRTRSSVFRRTSRTARCAGSRTVPSRRVVAQPEQQYAAVPREASGIDARVLDLLRR